MNKHLMLTLPNATDEHVSSLISFLRGVSEWDLSLTDLDADFSYPDEKCSPEAEAAELRVARDAIAQQMIKGENEANDLMDENKELNQRVGELVAELAESELRASKFEKHNLQLQSANTALRANTLMTGVKVPAIGEKVREITEETMRALPVGAQFLDHEGDIITKRDEAGFSWWNTRVGIPFLEADSELSPYTRIANAEDQETQ